METPESLALVGIHFARVEDPRIDRTRLHSLHDILVLALAAVIAGCDGWVEVEDFCKAREDWFRAFLELPNGIPSHDTFGRLFSRLAPEQLTSAFAAWTGAVASTTEGRVIAIDGKTARRSYDGAAGKPAVHMVSAWACDQGLVLGQIATEEKSNEITAIPLLLQVLDLKGAIVTIDAMGTQKTIARSITDGGGSYILALKGNHPTMEQEVREFFDNGDAEGWGEDIASDFAETADKGHGRIELRRCRVTSEVSWFEDRQQWAGLRSFVRVQEERTVKGKTSRESRYFLSSLDGSDARKVLDAVRAHWQIENSLHWVLDMTFGEDGSRIRKDNAPQNAVVLRHMALNALKLDTSSNKSIRLKRKLCSWDADFHEHILFGAMGQLALE